VPFEVLDFAFVPFGGLSGFEGAQVAASSGLGVLFSRVKAKFTGC
jgi:hypothetical protein